MCVGSTLIRDMNIQFFVCEPCWISPKSAALICKP